MQRQQITATITTKLSALQSLTQKALNAIFPLIVDATQTPAERGAWLRTIIRRFPYCTRARRALGELALEQKDYALAYSEAQALVALGGGYTSTGYFLLARTLLGTGAVESAQALFLKLVNGNPTNIGYREELAAAYMAAGDLNAAKDELERIPENQLTPSARAALSFAQLRTQPVQPE